MQYNITLVQYYSGVLFSAKKKKMNYQAMERHEGNLNACYQLKEAYLITV